MLESILPFPAGRLRAELSHISDGRPYLIGSGKSHWRKCRMKGTDIGSDRLLIASNRRLLPRDDFIETLPGAPSMTGEVNMRMSYAAIRSSAALSLSDSQRPGMIASISRSQSGTAFAARRASLSAICTP